MSFWPPKIGARPAGTVNAEAEPAEDGTTTEGRISRVKLPPDQIGYFSLISGGEIGSAWPIRSGDRTLKVGASSDSDIYLPDQNSVSRTHFSVYVRPTEGAQQRGYQFFVHDMGSNNGTYVNGKKVGYEPYEVADKDKIQAGACEFILHVTSGDSESVEMTGGSGGTVLIGQLDESRNDSDVV